jgi:hypothetical protein
MTKRIFALLAASAILTTVAWCQEIPLRNWKVPEYWSPPAEPTTGNPGVHANSGPISTGMLTFVAISPCRLMETRFISAAAFGPPSLIGQLPRTVSIPGNCGVPFAAAYSLNFTVVVPSGGVLGFLTAYPDTLPQPPNIATLNAPLGGVIGNSAIVPGGPVTGGINVFATNNTDLIIDINGYFIDAVDKPGNGGTDNVGVGLGTLQSSTGNANTAVGTSALQSNTNGLANSAFGFFALSSHTKGQFNSGFGWNALKGLISGSSNVALGALALEKATGSRNVAIGISAGASLVTGNDNIYISSGSLASESGVIRIGSTGGPQFSTFIGGIYGVSLTNTLPVEINSTGQLSAPNLSSRRYKDDIQDMAGSSDNLMRLRPVTFRYKQSAQDGTKPLQYGLIAEEVEQLYPEAVVYNLAGQIEAVQYSKINAMLLNEVQKQHRQLEQQNAEIQSLNEHLSRLESTLNPR